MKSLSKTLLIGGALTFCAFLPLLAMGASDRQSSSEQLAYYSTDKRTVKCKEAYLKRKYKKAYKRCLSAAEDGNLLAMVNLGYIKKKGIGEKSTKYWFEKSAEQGYPDAQYELAGEYFDFDGATTHFDGSNANRTGLIWYIKAAEAEHGLAQSALGSAYEKGVTVKRDYKKAAYWYEKAAAHNNFYAQGRLKLIYGNGQARESDANVAAAKIVNSSDVDTYLNQIQVSKNWIEPGDAKSKELYDIGMKIFEKWDSGNNPSFGKTHLVDAISAFKKASDRGHAKAFYMQGVVHWYMYVDNDPEQAAQDTIALYTRSGDLGYLRAQLALTYKYMSGKDIVQSYPQAAYWYRKAAQQGDIVSMETLQFLLLSGDVDINSIPQSSSGPQHKMTTEESFFAGLEAGFKKNFSKAETLLGQSANEGNVKAQAALGRMYYEGEGIPRSLEDAYKWYKVAGLEGDIQSQYMMGYMWQHNEARAGAAQEGLVLDLYPDPTLRAKWWYEKAAAHFHENAKRQLQSIANYTPPPPPPAPKPGWFEKFAIDTYQNAMKDPNPHKPSISTYSGGNDVYHPERCYQISARLQQCFRD